MKELAKVFSRSEKRSGTSKNDKPWVSQDYIVVRDFDKEYPRYLKINFFGEQRVNEAAALLHKDTLAYFDYEVESREITTKAGDKMWITSCNCTNITIPQPTQQPTQQIVQPAPAPQQTADPFTHDESGDDLPF